jgi:hypothetical protein
MWQGRKPTGWLVELHRGNTFQFSTHPTPESPLSTDVQPESPSLSPSEICPRLESERLRSHFMADHLLICDFFAGEFHGPGDTINVFIGLDGREVLRTLSENHRPCNAAGGQDFVK